MKALLLQGARDLQVCDMPQPQVSAHDVLVRVKACGICGSDVHGYDGSTGRRIPPLVMGHEAAGVVQAVGDSVRAVRPGQRVTFDPPFRAARAHSALRVKSTFANIAKCLECPARITVGMAPLLSSS